MTQEIANAIVNATRQKYRFSSERGDLTVEQLWDLPLTSRNGFNLNAVAIAVNAELKGITEESFVDVSPNPRRSQLEQMLEIAKFVIATKQDEAKEANEAAAKATMRKRLQEAIEAKRNEALGSASIEELEAQLAALSA